ncbi:hypothetical protein KWH04_01065 [Xanthomonas campestris pv. trichodesmae]|uniref:DNA-binding protein n=2 Tax=Xanthomonas citri TaxID=346 RepID=A0AB33CCD3_XANCI|nr:hypothetical protein [Xanthomonas citri]ASK91068.1 hypothetical protein XcvCFBP7111P_05745 [Xanthomonas citri pv. vignicola]MBV6779260.1 hypothetical protein [Xanthomonas campestris pv. trichodesmae]MBZ3921774.1 hypothetical protein [Xanthomonas campestris pv. trichodesmae]MBZ3926374.1 hypothetical protein [Xanthomonas citri pv. sesbaniae]
MQQPAPGLDLNRKVRAAFIAQGTTLKGWCRDNDIRFSNARECLIGSRNGPKSQALRARIIKASGMRAAA